MTDDDTRNRAVERIKNRRELLRLAAGFVLASALLVLIWVMSGGGYFWPGWIIGVMAVFLAVRTYHVYGERPISESDIEREMGKTDGTSR